MSEKNFVIYIGTFGDKQLAEGAAKSIIKNCKDDFDLILLNFNTDINIQSKYFNKIINLECLRWMGIFTINRLKETRCGIYIDDDVRLLCSVSLKEKYAENIYKPINGCMVVAWDDPRQLFKKPFKVMIQWRMHKLCHLINDEKLANMCSINQCEQIDSIWVHLDKCSESRTQDRQELIDYIDNHGGDVSHSVNS